MDLRPKPIQLLFLAVGLSVIIGAEPLSDLPRLAGIAIHFFLAGYCHLTDDDEEQAVVHACMAATSAGGSVLAPDPSLWRRRQVGSASYKNRGATRSSGVKREAPRCGSARRGRH